MFCLHIFELSWFERLLLLTADAAVARVQVVPNTGCLDSSQDLNCPSKPQAIFFKGFTIYRSMGT